MWTKTNVVTKKNVKVTTYVKGEYKYNFVSTEDSFLDIAWRKLDLMQCINILSSGETSFRGHEYVIFSALCAWVIDPKSNTTIRKNSITLAVARLLSGAEKRAIRERRRTKSEDYGLVTALSPSFYNEIYFPIGGLQRIISTPSRTGLVKKRAPFLRHHNIACTMMGIDHYHRDNLSNTKGFGSASIRKSSELVQSIHEKLGESAPDAKNVENKHYRIVLDSLPFSYAAKSIILDDGRTLFDAMFERDLHVRDFSAVCLQWFKRTLYVANHVLNREADAKTATRLNSREAEAKQAEFIVNCLAGHKPEVFGPPEYILNNGTDIKDIYKHGGLAARKRRS
ncbi:hypothetical protein [Methylobacterium crusticola]|nr:hypothetical protein [Methylobacterium crusticola]